MEQERTRRLMQANGRCIAAVIFAFFGGCWLLWSFNFAHRLDSRHVIATVVVTLLLVSLAVASKRSLPKPANDAELQQQHARDSRRFGWINAVTYSTVFIAGAVMPRFGLSNYVIPVFVALVGLHFFPMTGLYRHTANLVTGGVLVLLAAAAAVAVHTDPYGVTAKLTFGAGVVLWLSAVWAMRTAKLLAV